MPQELTQQQAMQAATTVGTAGLVGLGAGAALGGLVLSPMLGCAGALCKVASVVGLALIGRTAGTLGGAYYVGSKLTVPQVAPTSAAAVQTGPTAEQVATASAAFQADLASALESAKKKL